MSILSLLGEDDGGPLVYVEREPANTVVYYDRTAPDPWAGFDPGYFPYERITDPCDGCPVRGVKGWPAVKQARLFG